MDNVMENGRFGLSWVLPEGRDLIRKSLAPSFIFVDFETFISTNVKQRLSKRGISAFVSIPAPLGAMAHEYGWSDALRLTARPEGKKAVESVAGRVSEAIAEAVDAGADAIILCDDLCGSSGPLVDPIFVVEHLMPLYRRFAAEVNSYKIPAFFHSDGDVREYYPALAEDGYSGVHIAHPMRRQVSELFAAARNADLLPLGGIIAANILMRDPEEDAAFVEELLSGGEAFICDDGATSSLDEIEAVLEVIARCRGGV